MSYPESIVIEIPTGVAADLSALLSRYGSATEATANFHRELAKEVENAQAQSSLFEATR